MAKHDKALLMTALERSVSNETAAYNAIAILLQDRDPSLTGERLAEAVGEIVLRCRPDDDLRNSLMRNSLLAAIPYVQESSERYPDEDIDELASKLIGSLFAAEEATA